MTSMPQLTGAVQDHRDRIIASLEQEIRTLKEQLRDAQEEAQAIRNESSRGAAELRQLLSPLHHALKLVFGELDTLAPESGSSRRPTNNKAVWDAWKSRLGSTTAKVIDALMTHAELNTQQIAIATGLDKRTVSNTAIYRLNQAGLINKNGGKFSLKELP